MESSLVHVGWVRLTLRLRAGLLGVAVLCALAACSSGRASEERELIVFAASSLRDVFTSLGEAWKAEHPEVPLVLSFAGTQELRTQLEHGAPADVFAAADELHMDALTQSGRVRAPSVFARNEPVIVVSDEARGTLRSLQDLPRTSRLVVGAAEVPIGRYTLQILNHASGPLGAGFRAEVERRVVSRELNVRQVLNKVKLGEAEAGVVYRSDAHTAPELSVVEIPSELNVIAQYPIAVVADAKHPQHARAWVELVGSERGRRALERAGFLLPEAGTP